jgi:membrane protein YqaA with SNARE-associated domain
MLPRPPLSLLTNPVWTWLRSLGGPGLILVGILDNSAIPLPGSMDVFVVLLAAQHGNWWAYYAIMGTVGAVVGGYLTYGLGEKGEEKTLEKRIGKKRAEKVYKWFRKRGFLRMVVGSIMPPPFPMSPLLLAAGALHYPRKKFLASLSLGRSVRYFALAYMAHVYGKAIIGWLTKYYHPLLYILIGLASTGAIGALVYFKWYRPKRQQEERKRGEAVEQFPVPYRKNREKTG